MFFYLLCFAFNVRLKNCIWECFAIQTWSYWLDFLKASTICFLFMSFWSVKLWKRPFLVSFLYIYIYIYIYGFLLYEYKWSLLFIVSISFAQKLHRLIRLLVIWTNLFNNLHLDLDIFMVKIIVHVKQSKLCPLFNFPTVFVATSVCLVLVHSVKNIELE